MSVAIGGDVDYACARVAAREGARADAAAWARIETARELRVMLDVARSAGALSPLHDWTTGIAAEQDPHEIERALRGHWREAGAEAVRWMPQRWQPAVAWAVTLELLPWVDALRRRTPMPPGFGDEDERAQMERTLATLPPAADGAGVLHAWRDELARRLPASHAREAPLLPAWLRVLAAHDRAMREAPPGDASLLVASLRARLRALRRRAMLEPTAVFVYVTQRALDLARFRGEIMRRKLLPHVTATA
ncbi:MAG: hypothetical protein U1F54_19495 [Burkholderiales bacterium]